MLLSETEVYRFCREPEGLKRPGEDMGVLFAVLKGMEAEGGRCVYSGGVGRAVIERDDDDCCCDSDLWWVRGW